MSLNNNKEILKKIKNGLSSDDLQAGNGVTITKDETSGKVTINSNGSGSGSSTVEVSAINGNIINNGEELKVYDDTDCMKISEYASETDNTSVKLADEAKSIVGANTAQPKQFYGVDSQGNVGWHYQDVEGSAKGGIEQRVILNPTANNTSVMESAKDLTECKCHVECYKFIEGEQDIISILKTFNNAEIGNFYYDDNIEFTNDAMQIKTNYDINFTENNGLYTSDAINQSNYIGGIEVVDL